MSIRDTSAQDRPVATPASHGARKRRGWLLAGGIGLLALGVALWGLHMAMTQGLLAAMIADPEDLLRGQRGSGETVVMSSTKAIEAYREAKPTGDGNKVSEVASDSK